MEPSGLRQPGRMKSKTSAPQTPHQQLLSIAQKIIDSAADPTLLKKYYRLKDKLFQVGSALKTPQRLSTPKRLSSISKTTTNLKGGTTTVKRKDYSNSKKTDRSELSEKKKSRPKSTHSRKPSAKGNKDKMEAVITAVCDETCVNLNLLREKILRREYSRKHIKQIKPDIKKKVTGILPEKSELLPKIEAVQVAFDRAVLALDVISMKIKQQLKGKGTETQTDISEKMRKDNCWLLDKVQQLLNQNYLLRSKVVTSAVENICEQVRVELTDKKG